MSFLKRLPPGSGPSSGACLIDPDFSERFPALFEYLTATRYPDGSARRASSLSVFSEDASWKACLNERDQDLVLFVTESRFDTLLEALELLLKMEVPPWRKSKPSGARGAGKGRSGS